MIPIDWWINILCLLIGFCIGIVVTKKTFYESFVNENYRLNPNKFIEEIRNEATKKGLRKTEEKEDKKMEDKK